MVLAAGVLARDGVLVRKEYREVGAMLRKELAIEAGDIHGVAGSKSHSTMRGLGAIPEESYGGRKKSLLGPVRIGTVAAAGGDNDRRSVVLDHGHDLIQTATPEYGRDIDFFFVE